MLPFCEQVEHLFAGRERAVRVEEHVDVRRLELARVARQRLDEALEGAGLQEPDAHRLPLEVGDAVLIVRVGGLGGRVVSDFLEVHSVYGSVHALLPP